jgi:hypothetical protein
MHPARFPRESGGGCQNFEAIVGAGLFAPYPYIHL